MLSLIHDPTLEYPLAPFSPDEAFPEYRLGHVSPTTNRVYRSVRACFAQAGLDSSRFGSAEWNPLGSYVRRGASVFVLCNFMNHRQANQSIESFSAECTHASVLRPILDYLLIAAGPDGKVSFGNAPIQFCDWDSVMIETGAQDVLSFYQTLGIPVRAVDLRLFAARFHKTRGVTRIERRAESDGIEVDLGADSLLVDLDCRANHRYRIMNYDPKRTDRFHRDGRHVYVINRHILEAEFIFDLCKLKTHEKVGITCALKGFVGAVGHKDSLPHHRFGSPDIGGDEYPLEGSPALRLLSEFHDRAQATAPGQILGNGLRLADRAFRRAADLRAPLREGAWWGNDTAWRMVLDVARAVAYADTNGEMRRSPQREHLALIDGIIAGEGNGPYWPTAYRYGLLLLSDNLAAADYAAATMMGYRPEDIPLVREALRLPHYRLLKQRTEC